MRIVKEAEERKNEILDVAGALFARKGYDGTSTNDILKEIGIARGTLYYHFKSKEDILDALISRMTDQLVAKADHIASDLSVPVVKRISYAMQALNIDTELAVEVMQQMHKPQNALMHQKMQTYLVTQVVPIITRLALEGIEEGIFSTQYPKEAVEMILIYGNEAFDDLMMISKEEQERKIQAFIYHTEKILGAAPGMLQQSMMEIFENGH